MDATPKPPTRIDEVQASDLMALTERQRAIIRAIRQHQQRIGKPPSIRALAAKVRLPQTTVYRTLDFLTRHKYLTYVEGEWYCYRVAAC